MTKFVETRPGHYIVRNQKPELVVILPPPSTLPLPFSSLGVQGGWRRLSGVRAEGGVHTARRSCHKDCLHQ